MTSDLPDIAHALLDAATSAGAENADVIVLSGQAVSIEVREGVLENAERAEGTDLGLRVLIGQKQANVSASDTQAATLARMAERAVAMAREAPDDPHLGLADPSQLVRDADIAALELADPAPEPSAAELQEDALACEAAARANPDISQVQSAGATYNSRQIWLAATNGFSNGYARTARSRSCVAIAGEGQGMERDYDGDSRTFGAELRTPSDIGASASARAVARLGARKPVTGSYPVLFDERISASLIGHLVAAANGAAIARGASWLRDARGSAVLPEGMSLTEDPTRPRIAASRPFDAEGLPCQPLRIIDAGQLTGWTLDLATARKLGLAPTGNAARGTGSGPSPSTWNLSLTQGSRTHSDLIRDMGTGLLVTSLIGATINPNTGDYSRGASGFWVENGEIVYPVNECTIAGNLREMLLRLEPGNDARTYLSRVVPSLLIDGLSVAGS